MPTIHFASTHYQTCVGLRLPSRSGSEERLAIGVLNVIAGAYAGAEGRLISLETKANWLMLCLLEASAILQVNLKMYCYRQVKYIDK